MKGRLSALRLVCAFYVYFGKMYLAQCEPDSKWMKFYQRSKLAWIYIGLSRITEENGTHWDAKFQIQMNTLRCVDLAEIRDCSKRTPWEWCETLRGIKASTNHFSSRQYCFRASRGAEEFVRGLGPGLVAEEQIFVRANYLGRTNTSQTMRPANQTNSPREICLINLLILAVRLECW